MSWFSDKRHLRELLANSYHGEVRTHLALGNDAPLLRPLRTFDGIAPLDTV
jgi:hypothetical protein